MPLRIPHPRCPCDNNKHHRVAFATPLSLPFSAYHLQQPACDHSIHSFSLFSSHSTSIIHT
jgi:hypothetical protein